MSISVAQPLPFRKSLIGKAQNPLTISYSDSCILTNLFFFKTCEKVVIFVGMVKYSFWLTRIFSINGTEATGLKDFSREHEVRRHINDSEIV